MTSISGSMSPSDRMQMTLQSMVSAGSVKATDQNALSSAITDIDSAMKAGATSNTASTTPGDMKSKVDGLIDQDVTDGKLTSDQATELKQVFAQAAQGMGHHHGHHVSSSSSSNNVIDELTSTSTDPLTADSTTGTSTTSSAASGTDSLTQSIQTLMSFLQKLEQTTSSATNYTSSGTSASSLASSLLVNLNA